MTRTDDTAHTRRTPSKLSPDFEARLVEDATNELLNLSRVLRHLWPGQDCEQLLRIHRDHRGALSDYMRIESGLAKSILNFWDKSAQAFTNEGILFGLGLNANIMAILAQLYSAYSAAFAEPLRLGEHPKPASRGHLKTGQS